MPKSPDILSKKLSNWIFVTYCEIFEMLLEKSFKLFWLADYCFECTMHLDFQKINTLNEMVDNFNGDRNLTLAGLFNLMRCIVAKEANCMQSFTVFCRNQALRGHLRDTRLQISSGYPSLVTYRFDGSAKSKTR